MYRKTGIAPLRRHLDEGMLGPTLPYEKVQTRIFSEDEVRRAHPQGLRFINLNTLGLSIGKPPVAILRITAPKPEVCRLSRSPLTTLDILVGNFYSAMQIEIVQEIC